MTDLDLLGIARKLSGMTRRLDLLNKYQSISLDNYLKNEELQLLIKRLLELIIQSALDINRMLLKYLESISRTDRSQSVTNADTFRFLSIYGLISSDLAEELARSGQFRNLLAHLYDDIDSQQVYLALQATIEIYPAYIEAIQDFIDANDSDDVDLID